MPQHHPRVPFLRSASLSVAITFCPAIVARPAWGQIDQQSTKHWERVTIAYRPMRIDSSAALQHVHASGFARVLLAIDSSGHAVPGSVHTEEASDSALATLAGEITSHVLWDSATALRAAGREVIRLRYVFLLSVAGAPAAMAGGGNPQDVGYLITRVDSAAPATAEALVSRCERLSGPMPEYPMYLREEHESGSVMVEAVIDTSGHAEAGSLRVMSSSNHGFDRSALRTVEGSVFRVTRTPWHAVRVLIHIPISYAVRF